MSLRGPKFDQRLIVCRASTIKMKKQGAKGKNNTKMAPKMPNGTEVVDISKTTWKIGDAIGSGGFGLIYLTQKCPLSGPVSSKAEQVMKLEPHDSGPLFCEQAFFQRAAKQESVKAFMSTRRISSLGLPSLLGLGSHTHNGDKLRFLVLPRFSTDLQKIFEEGGRRFSPGAVFRVGMQVMDVLEYIHSQGYAHADIKAANLMIGIKDPNQVYLIDFGLAFKFLVEGNHKEYKEDPRKAHDGTAEYASRDAHRGVWPSARGDLETLGYCMWQWLVGKLPWEGDISNKPLVAQQKNKYMGNIDGHIAPLIKDQTSSKTLCKYLGIINKLEYDESPKYDVIRQLFSSALASLKCKANGRLDFSVPRADMDLMSPVRRSGRTSKVQVMTKSRLSMLKSPPPKSTAAVKQVAAGKSPARVAPRERMFSPSPRSRAVASAAAVKETATKVATDTLKRKRDDIGGETPKRMKTKAKAIEETPVLARSPFPRVAKEKKKRPKPPKSSASTQTTPGLRARR